MGGFSRPYTSDTLSGIITGAGDSGQNSQIYQLLEDWHPLPFASGILNYSLDKCYFTKDRFGFVSLRGVCASTNSISAGTVIATLPAGYRPGFQIVSAGLASTGASTEGMQRVDVAADGTVKVGPIVSWNATYLSLNDVRFWAPTA